jgi:hypothetical protein
MGEPEGGTHAPYYHRDQGNLTSRASIISTLLTQRPA